MVASGGAPLRQAGDRFVAFFRELQGAFIEREDVLKQIALALLAREHVLMTGPPGTAKSQLAHRVLGRIVSQDTGGPACSRVSSPRAPCRPIWSARSTSRR